MKEVSMEQPTILVTGGTGFAGTHLLRSLLQHGYTHVYSTCFSPVQEKNRILPADHYLPGDLRDAGVVDTIIKSVRPDWVFHLAAFAYVGKSFSYGEDVLTNNILLTLHVLESIMRYVPGARVLSIGSAEEYGYSLRTTPLDEQTPLNPVNPYGVSKVAQDLLAASFALSRKTAVIRARPFNHIGTGQSGDFAIPAFAQQIVAIENGEQEVLHVGNLSGIRDFTSVADMVEAYIVLLTKGDVGQVYNIGSGVGVVMSDVVTQMISYAKKPISKVTDPDRLRPLDVPCLIADNRKIAALGWKPKVLLQTELENVLNEWRLKVQKVER